MYLPPYEKDEGGRNVPSTRSSSRSPPRRNSSRSSGLGLNPSPAAVALHQQLIKQRAMKAAADAAATNPFGTFNATAAGFMDPPGLYQPLQLPSPRASFCSTLDSSGSFATFPSADSFPLSPCNSGSYALSPAVLSALPANSSAVSPAVLAAPQQQFYAIGGSFNAGVQEGCLQQQEADLNAALVNLITFRQQLAAMRTSTTAPTQQQQALFAAPAAHPVSAATVGLADALVAPQALPAPVSPSTAVAQLQLASLQAQQQQLVSVEAQLQAELAAQMVRMLGL